jgi:hypothetical protein
MKNQEILNGRFVTFMTPPLIYLKGLLAAALGSRA